MNWSHDNWDTLYKRTSRKETPDVRTCFIHFLLSFLMDPSPVVIKEYLGQKTRLINIFSGMMHDSLEMVVMVLDTLKTKVLENSGVNKTLKMRLFGSNTIKQILSLLKWTGGSKVDAEETDEGHKEIVKETVTAFIKTLLGSKRHGVIFPDPAVGQLDNLNHLVKEVIVSLGASKPWEDATLASILTDLVAACPDQLPAALHTLEPHWEVRESASWLQVTELASSLVSGVDVAAVTESVPANTTVIEKIVSNILLPSKLVTKVLAPGLQLVDSVPVWSRCCQLLSLMVTNVDKYLTGLRVTRPSQAAAAEVAAVKILRSVTDIQSLWSQVTRLLAAGDLASVLHVLNLAKFWVRELAPGPAHLETVRVGELLQQLSAAGGEAVEAAAGVAVQLRALELLSLLTRRTDSGLGLASICTRQTFRLLLQIITTSDTAAEQHQSALDTFSGLVRSAGICLSSEKDLDILLALGEYLVHNVTMKLFLFPFFLQSMRRAVKVWQTVLSKQLVRRRIGFDRFRS